MAGHFLRPRGSEQLCRLCMQLLQCDLDRIALEDAAELLDLGGKGAVGAAVAVRKRAAADRAPAQLSHGSTELEPEPRFPDPGRAENRDQVRRPLVGDSFPDALKDTELSTATDERPARDRAFAGREQRFAGHPGRDNRRLALRLDRGHRLVLDRVPRGGIRLFADDDPVDRRRRLQPGGGPSETRASPVLTAIRIWRSNRASPLFSSCTLSRTERAARTARSASSP